ncbi:phage holin family protein [Streptomyces asoensis]|uniref:phage holin family protein n=1 Tax=Streptomyces TaxID=1883 RepID=UPI00190C6744|nr:MULTISPECIES: phage holin family protein [unclassified Streptomyces]MBK3626968.1 phage holin family protein [Streptomyces sp. MBT49]MBK3632061.1 phage holin family protein [Streptomyces sp. MBT97]
MSAPDGSPVGAERSIGQLFASATTELSALVHDEIALAKAQLKQDVKRGATSGGAFSAAGALLVFSLPMLNFALAYGIRTWSDWNLAICFLLSFAANVLIALVLVLIGVVFAKKAQRGKGPQKVAASVKESASVLQNAKPHPRPELPQDRVPEAIEAVARSSS